MDLSSRQRRRRRYEVNIVPMIDVMTVLIFFFLITMQFKEIRSVEIIPPTMSTSEKTSDIKPYVIGISREGEYFFNDKKLSLNELERALKNLASTEKTPNVVLLADKDCPYGFVAAGLDTVRLAKIKKISMQSGAAKK